MITASIVLYKNRYNDIKTVIDCLNKSNVGLIYIIDNSPSDDLKKHILNISPKIEYIYGQGNVGYGSAHNIAIRRTMKDKDVKYHLVLNYDISFCSSTIESLLLKIDSNKNVGMIMPKILNNDGSIQLLPKLLPTPFNLLIHAFKPLRYVFHRKEKEYVLEDHSGVENNVPVISGCFSIFRIKTLQEFGLYDEKFFMYFEDFDLSRRIHSRYETVYFPSVTITHSHERGASKNFRLFRIFISSCIYYFNKYGWLFDQERRKINFNVINRL